MASGRSQPPARAITPTRSDLESEASRRTETSGCSAEPLPSKSAHSGALRPGVTRGGLQKSGGVSWRGRLSRPRPGPRPPGKARCLYADFVFGPVLPPQTFGGKATKNSVRGVDVFRTVAKRAGQRGCVLPLARRASGRWRCPSWVAHFSVGSGHGRFHDSIELFDRVRQRA